MIKMRIQLEFHKRNKLNPNNATADTFLKVFKSMWGDMKVRKLKGHSKWSLRMDAKYLSGKIDKEYLRRRVDEVLGDRIFVFHAYNLRVGEPAKCHTCNGTGKSYYPADFWQTKGK